MPNINDATSLFIGGIADSEKAANENQVAFERAMDFRTDPKKMSVLPRARLDSGAKVTGLPMWMTRACNSIFAYDTGGSIYKKENGTWQKEHTASNSSGNGLEYFGEDGNMYYAQDTTLGRKTQACTSLGDYYDGFLETEGGEPTNTKSMSFTRSSGVYAYVADNSNLSITSDISIEDYIKLTDLPDTDEKYTLSGKWNEQSNQKSFRTYLTTGSNFFGDGRDGALSITTPTTDDPIDANCSGTAGQKIITLYNEHSSFNTLADGDKVIIWQTRGTGNGLYEIATVSSYSSGTLTLQESLKNTYYYASGDYSLVKDQPSAQTAPANKAQVILLKQYTTASITADWTAKAWDGFKGGFLGFYANSTVTVNATISGNAKGFRGGVGFNLGNYTGQGEGSTGWAFPSTWNGGIDFARSANNGSGGGASRAGVGASGGGGVDGQSGNLSIVSDDIGKAGVAVGDSNLTKLNFGGGAAGSNGNNSQYGGKGGGVGLFFCYNMTVGSSGRIDFGGEDRIGLQGWDDDGPSGGGGGNILFKVQNLTNNGAINADGGTGGLRSVGVSSRDNGVDGGDGRIAIYYSGSVSATTDPIATLIEDSSLGNTDGYVFVFEISDDGSASERYQWDVTDLIDEGNWYRMQVKWDDVTSTAEAFINAVSLGTKTGSMTSIYDSTASFTLGATFDSSGNPQDYFNGLMDDFRLWNDQRTQSELATNNDTVLIGNEANLVAYYEFEGNANDSQTNVTANNLTVVNTFTTSNDIPFSGLTTRKDIDQEKTTGSFTGSYSVPTSITENDANRIYFVPDKDPQKSVTLDIDTVGTGDWTITVHNALNREVASVTVSNSEIASGFYEFVYDESFRPVRGATYHIHITSTQSDGVLDVLAGETTLSAGADTINAYFTTHYQILVSDIYHPLGKIVNKLVVGNERYVATFEGGDIYNPHALVFPSGYRVRCFARFRDYLAIGVWRGSDITDYEEGYIFFWDGISDTYNDVIFVPQGGINSLYGAGGVLYVSAGYTADIYAYTGGTELQNLKTLPLYETDQKVELSPSSMTMWRKYLSIGAALSTDSETIHKGVYTFGTKKSDYPYSLGFSYPLSLGDQTSTAVKIGVVFASGQDLYIGWQNGSSYGIDKVSVTNDQNSSATFELPIKDIISMSKEDYPLVFAVEHSKLKSGQIVRILFKEDRSDIWQTLETNYTEFSGDTRATLSTKCTEFQVKVDLISTIATQPEIYEVSFESNIDTGINI